MIGTKGARETIGQVVGNDGHGRRGLLLLLLLACWPATARAV